MKDTLVQKYALAITEGIRENIAATLSTAVRVFPPGSNTANEGQGKASMMLSAVASVVKDFEVVRIYAGSDGWNTVQLRGDIEGTAVQFIDQIHENAEGLVDQIDIFLRPAVMAETLLTQVTKEIQGRQSKA